MAYLAIGAGLCGSLAEAARPLPDSRPHSVRIENLTVHYEIPIHLAEGYVAPKAVIAFADSKSARGDADLSKEDIATFFEGVRGEFDDWDVSFALFALRAGHAELPIDNADKLLAFVRLHSPKEYKLMGGKALPAFEEPRIQVYGGTEVAVLNSALRDKILDVKLATGWETRIEPTTTYFFPISHELVLVLEVRHENKRRLARKYFAEAERVAERILGSVRVSRPDGPNRMDPKNEGSR